MVGVLAHPVKRDHHIFINFEGIRVTRNGGSTRPVEPKLFTRLGAHRNKAFAMTCIGKAYDFAGGRCHRRLIVTHNIAKQHHFGQHTALTFG